MKDEKKWRLAHVFGVLPAFLVFMFSSAFMMHELAGRTDANERKNVASLAPSSEPWTEAQTIKPADLAKEMADTNANRPVVVCSGVRVFYEGAHISGAVYHGPASRLRGLEDLKKWAQGISRSSNVVVYCGCCPFEKCPNIRPEFEALRSMGFQHLRVLVLPNSFAKDWWSKDIHTTA